MSHHFAYKNSAMLFNSLIAPFLGIWPIVTILIQIVVALYVFSDASRRASVDPASVKVIPAPLWALLCLIGGIPALALYWVAHHSTLAK